MRAISSLITKAGGALVALGAMTSRVLAEGYDLYDSYVYDSYTSDPSGDAFAAMFTGGFAIFYICLILVGCVLFVFNIWMLVDVLKRTEAEVPNKTLWMVLLLVGLFVGFGWLAAIIYYFSVKRKLAK